MKKLFIVACFSYSFCAFAQVPQEEFIGATESLLQSSIAVIKEAAERSQKYYAALKKQADEIVALKKEIAELKLKLESSTNSSSKSKEQKNEDVK